MEKHFAKLVINHLYQALVALRRLLRGPGDSQNIRAWTPGCLSKTMPYMRIKHRRWPVK